MTLLNTLFRLLRSDTVLGQQIRWAIKLFILVALFVALFWIIPINKVILALFTVKWDYLLLGLLLSLGSTILTALEMEPLTRHQGISHRFGDLLEINLAAKFYNQFMPTALVASGYRWYRLSQPEGKRAESLAALAFFRSLETFLNLAVGLVFWMLSRRSASSFTVDVIGVGGGLLAIAVAWYLVTRKSIPLYTWLKEHGAQFLESPFWLPLARRLEKFLVALSAYANFSLGGFILAISAGILSLMCGILSGMVMAWAVNIDIGFFEMGWIQALIVLATQLPLAVAGGVGIREVTLVTLLATYGVSGERSLALSFLLFLRGVVIALLGGLLELIRSWQARPIQSG